MTILCNQKLKSVLLNYFTYHCNGDCVGKCSFGQYIVWVLLFACIIYGGCDEAGARKLVLPIRVTRHNTVVFPKMFGIQFYAIQILTNCL